MRSPCPTKKFVPSPTSRSNWSEFRSPGSHSDRECAAFERAARAHQATLKNHSNIRQRPAMCLRSSAARPSPCSRCWTRWSKLPRGSATAIERDRAAPHSMAAIYRYAAVTAYARAPSAYEKSRNLKPGPGQRHGARALPMARRYMFHDVLAAIRNMPRPPSSRSTGDAHGPRCSAPARTASAIGAFVLTATHGPSFHRQADRAD